MAIRGFQKNEPGDAHCNRQPLSRRGTGCLTVAICSLCSSLASIYVTTSFALKTFVCFVSLTKYMNGGVNVNL